jgi:nicotinamidase-related amidase
MVFHRQIFNSKLRVSNGDKSRAAIVSPLSKYRNAGAPAIDFLHAALEGAPVFTSGIELANEFDELTPYKGEGIVTKQFPGSFTQTDLQGILKAACRTKVVLTGYMVCIVFLAASS